MADAKRSSKSSRLTRGKAIVIVVLAVVLVAILYIQFGSSGATASSTPVAFRAPRRPTAPQPAEAAATKSAAGANAKTPAGASPNPSSDRGAGAAVIIDVTRWKSPELPTVTAFDPFALPPKFPQPAKSATNGKAAGAEGLIAAAADHDAKKLADAVEKLRMQLKELEARGVNVIIRERDEYAAMIGDRMLHVGDEINGFTVTAIDPSGVSVERKKSP